MERKSNQILAWRNIVELAISFTGRVSDQNQDLFQFILAVRQGLEVENWSDFERILKAIFFGFSPRSTGMYYTRHSLEEELEKALKHFEPTTLEAFRITIETDVLIMKPTSDVNLRITKGPRDGIVFRFKFGDPKTGTAFNEMIGERLGSNNSIQFGEVVYENAINLRSKTSDLWIFSNGSFDRLDGRAVSNNGGIFDRYQAFVVRPLAGEQMVVYDSQGARDIGLHVPWSRTIPHHPDTTVFASIGPFSMTLKRGEPKPGRPSYDRVIVFIDDRLPIAPPPRDEFKDSFVYEDWVNDGDPADRDPVEY